MSQAVLVDAKALRAAAPHLELGREVASSGGWTTFAARRVDENRRVMVRVGSLERTGLGRDASQVAGAIGRLKSLQHPGLATIAGGGVAGANAFLEIEHVRGLPIGAFLERTRLSSRQRCELAAQVCEAVAYLQERGISYGSLLPAGVWVARQTGSLRISVKLPQWERVCKYTADGSDQRALGELLKKLVESAPAGAAGAQELAEKADLCAASTGDAPMLSELSKELRGITARSHARSGANGASHTAEYLDVAPPKAIAPAKQAAAKRTKPAKTSVSNTTKTAAPISGVVIAVVLAVARAFNHLPDHTTNTSTHTPQLGAQTAPFSQPVTPSHFGFPDVSTNTSPPVPDQSWRNRAVGGNPAIGGGQPFGGSRPQPGNPGFGATGSGSGNDPSVAPGSFGVPHVVPTPPTFPSPRFGPQPGSSRPGGFPGGAGPSTPSTPSWAQPHR